LVQRSMPARARGGDWSALPPVSCYLGRGMGGSPLRKAQHTWGRSKAQGKDVIGSLLEDSSRSTTGGSRWRERGKG